MQRINLNLRPSGGYVFRDTDGSTHRGLNWLVVIEKVRGYRQRKGLDPGNAAEEVMKQSCERYPRLCSPEAQGVPHDGLGPKPPPERRSQPSLKARILMWCATLFNSRVRGEQMAYVTEQDALNREHVCRACPQNQPFLGSGCGSCKQAASDYRNGVIPGRSQSKILGGCAILGVDLVTAVHLDEVRIEHPLLPPNCWRKIVT